MIGWLDTEAVCLCWQGGLAGSSRVRHVNPADQPAHPRPGPGVAECRGPGRTPRQLPGVAAELPGAGVEQCSPAAGPRRAYTHRGQGRGRQPPTPGTRYEFDLFLQCADGVNLVV